MELAPHYFALDNFPEGAARRALQVTNQRDSDNSLTCLLRLQRLYERGTRKDGKDGKEKTEKKAA